MNWDETRNVLIEADLTGASLTGGYTLPRGNEFRR